MSKQTRKPVHAVSLQSDGHKRLTEAEQFTIRGGTEESHGRMTETLMHMQEKLKRKGRDFTTCSPQEFRDVAGEHGYK